MSHNSLPHNLTEVCEAVIAYIQRGSLTIEGVMEFIKGPDFPLGGTVLNSRDITAAFASGKSKISLKVRGDYIIEGNKIIFTTIPYRTYRNKIKEQIEESIDIFDNYFSDFNDESSLGNNRLVFTLKSGVDSETALNKLFALTDLQTTLSYNMNYIVNGTPKMCSIVDLIKAYVEHQEEVLTKATEYDKAKAEKRIHILEGFEKAFSKLDEVITLIKDAQDRASAREGLINLLSIDEEQANAILDMKLSRLTHMDKDKLLEELKDLREFLEKCIKILTDKGFRNATLVNKIDWLKNTYGDKRRTRLLDIELPKETKTKEKEILDIIITVDKTGGVRKLAKKTGNALKTTTEDTVFSIGSDGKVNRVPLSKKEFPSANDSLWWTTEFEKQTTKHLLFVTANGLVKRGKIEDITSMKRTGGAATKLKDGDKLVAVAPINDEDIVLTTVKGYKIRFSSTGLMEASRVSQGLKGIALEDGDTVKECKLEAPDKTKCQIRGGKGKKA